MKKVSLYFMRFLEICLCIIILSFGFIFKIDAELGLLIPKNIEWVLLILFGIMFVLYLLEFIIVLSIKRMVFFIFAGIIFIMMKLDSMSYFNVSIWFFSLIYLVMMIVTIARTSIHLETNNEGRKSIFGLQRVSPVKGKLNVAYASKKHRMLSYVCLFLSVLISFSFLLLNIHPLLQIIIIMGFAIMLYIILSIIINPLNHALRTMNKTAIYSNFKEKIEEFYKEPLHPEMLSYMYTLQANYLFAVDKEKAALLFESIEKPTFSSYLLTYCQIEIVYYINTERWEEAKQAITLAIEQFPKQSVIFKQYNQTIKILGTSEPISNIETLYPLNTNKKFLNLVNAYVLMMCYFIRQNAKAKIYARFILDHTQELKVYINKAEEILNLEEQI